MSVRTFISLPFLLFPAFAFFLTSCIFSPDHGPLSSGFYAQANPSRLFACRDQTGQQCDSLEVTEYWEVRTKRVLFKTYAGSRLFCRGEARLGDMSDDTLMMLDYRDSCMVFSNHVLNPLLWSAAHQDSLPFIIDQKSSRLFRARRTTDSAWLEFRQLR